MLAQRGPLSDDVDQRGIFELRVVVEGVFCKRLHGVFCSEEVCTKSGILGCEVTFEAKDSEFGYRHDGSMEGGRNADGRNEWSVELSFMLLLL